MKHIISISALLESNILDDILDKISTTGMDSLNDEERWYLNNPTASESDYNAEHGIVNKEPAPDYIEYDDDVYDDPYGEEEENWEVREDLLNLSQSHAILSIDARSNGKWVIRFEYYPELLQELQELYAKHRGAITPKIVKPNIECEVDKSTGIWLSDKLS